MKERKQLSRDVDRKVERMKKAEKEHHTILGQTIYLTTLGLVLVLPLIAGAYLGRWLDSMLEGYSIRWTLSLLIIGLVVGAVNVYLLIRGR
ncbi:MULTISPECIES: AtpZ/AtpI family protein [Desulfosediminicola]|uniref:AtpZ/AtpI family protein n=1 Tax=Desulfosediminicola TaxID=2886823 RepID=UPI0010ACDED5|nr:AtpZ/AtpI family protein [Desulfosediminicola ganghwensis]